MRWQGAMYCVALDSNGIHSIVDRSPGHATDCTNARKILATKVLRNRLPYCIRGVRSYVFLQIYHNKTLPGRCMVLV